MQKCGAQASTVCYNYSAGDDLAYCLICWLEAELASVDSVS